MPAYQDADLLVGVLARDTVRGKLHEDGLGGHWKEELVTERQNIKVQENSLNGSSWSIRDRMTLG